MRRLVRTALLVLVGLYLAYVLGVVAIVVMAGA